MSSPKVSPSNALHPDRVLASTGSAPSGDSVATPESAAQYLTSDLLTSAGFEHAFFTRRGGVSEGPYASLNFSYAVGDESHCVDENLRRAGAVLGVSGQRLMFLAQVHGKTPVVLSGDEGQRQTMFVEGDAVIAKVADLACCVRTADCVPILIADRRFGAVAAVHAGWRGAVLNIAATVVAHLLQSWPDAELIAAIGPHISVDAFEVSADVAEQLGGASAIDPVRRRPGRKPHVDLRAIVRSQLEAAGLDARRIDDVAGCTFGNSDDFFSYRRDGKRSGRLLSAIKPLVAKS